MNQKVGTMELLQKQLYFRDILAFCLIFLEKCWVFEYNLVVSLAQKKKMKTFKIMDNQQEVMLKGKG